MIVEKKIKVNIEFPDVMAFIGNGITKEEREKVFQGIKSKLDIVKTTVFDDVRSYMASNATDYEKQEIFDLIEEDIDIPTDEIIGIECQPRNVLDEMALEKVQAFLELHGIQALADKL